MALAKMKNLGGEFEGIAEIIKEEKSLVLNIIDDSGWTDKITNTYNLPQDIGDNGYTYEYITTEETSIMKSMVKLGMGAVAAELGASAVSNRGETGDATGAVMAGAVAMKMSGTSTKQSVIVTLQFNDKSILTGEVSASDFSDFDDELNICDFDRYEKTMKGVLLGYNETMDDIRSQFSTMDAAEKKETSAALSSFKKLIPKLEDEIEKFRKEAKERGIGSFLEITTEEVTTPEATTPEATTPEATTPEATTPEATTTGGIGLYIIAILVPPIAVIMAKKKFGSILVNILLCFLFFIPGVIHALLIVKNRNEN
jgi:uncharacterized membrane protein YqaE (UPF0057 family)